MSAFPVRECMYVREECGQVSRSHVGTVKFRDDVNRRQLIFEQRERVRKPLRYLVKSYRPNDLL